MTERCEHIGYPGHALCSEPRMHGDRYCIFHSDNPNKDPRAFVQALQAKSDCDYAGYVFPNGDYFSKRTLNEANFTFAKFCGGALFEKTVFNGSTKFVDSRFNGGCYFRDARFSGECRFVDNYILSHSRFPSWVNFANASFGAALQFLLATCIRARADAILGQRPAILRVHKLQAGQALLAGPYLAPGTAAIRGAQNGACAIAAERRTAWPAVSYGPPYAGVDESDLCEGELAFVLLGPRIPAIAGGDYPATNFAERVTLAGNDPALDGIDEIRRYRPRERPSDR